jgi:hypothetical protein
MGPITCAFVLDFWGMPLPVLLSLFNTESEAGYGMIAAMQTFEILVLVNFWS